MQLNRNAALVVTVVLSSVLLASCDHAEKAGAKAEGTNETAQEMRPERLTSVEDKLLVLSSEDIRKAGIRVQDLQLQENSEEVKLTGTIEANQDKLARVAPRVSGRIVNLNHYLGDRVKGGEVLALLDSIELGTAFSDYLQARSEMELAQANLERSERLFQDKIAPKKDYLTARSELEKARAVLRAATDKLRMLGVEPSHVKDDKPGSVFPVVAPFAGTIIEKKAVVGELAMPEQSLFTVADLSQLWIETDLFEKDLANVTTGSAAKVSVAAYPGETFKGRLTYISSTIDKGSRTVKARVEVPNPNRRLKIGMFASVAIDTGKSVKALFLPEEAVLLLQGEPTVFVAKKGGFEPRAVATGQRLNGTVAIKSGLEAGEKAVVSGGYALKARLLKSQISGD